MILHTKDIPGSHVVIQYDGTPPDRTLNEAAQLAAWYSRARQSSAVPVDYTFRRYVKKPSGVISEGFYVWESGAGRIRTSSC